MIARSRYQHRHAVGLPRQPNNPGGRRLGLELAADENRIMVTFNVADFPDIARRWAEANRSHTGLMIIVGIDHREFGTIRRAIDRCLTTRPDQASWKDLTLFVSLGGR
jgi:hypothetical protein